MSEDFVCFGEGCDQIRWDLIERLAGTDRTGELKPEDQAAFDSLSGEERAALDWKRAHASSVTVRLFDRSRGIGSKATHP
jgi:hypothetical protein